MEHEADYKAAWAMIQSARSIALISHVNPDGDALGSSLALLPVLQQMGKKTSVVNVSTPLCGVFDFLPHFSKIKPALPHEVDLVVSLDSGSFALLGVERGAYGLLNIDHHISNESYGDCNLVDATQPSCSLVVYRLLEELAIPYGKDTAQCLYTGLFTDTGGFSYDNVRPEAFDAAAHLVRKGALPHVVARSLERLSLARFRLINAVLATLQLYCDGEVAVVTLSREMLRACGAEASEVQNLPGMALKLVTVEVVVLLSEEGAEAIKVSLRSKSRVEVNALAAVFGGGGHLRAAGATLRGHTMETAKTTILDQLKEMMKR